MTTTAVHLQNPPSSRSPITVTLIRPPVLTIPSSLSVHGPTPPIGLAYLAATLRDAGHQVAVVDAGGEGIDQLATVDSPIGPLQRRGLTDRQIVERIDPARSLIGITLMFVHEWPMVRALLPAIRARAPEAVVVVGGETATAFWPWMLEQTDAIDAIVLGEGEATVVAIADHVAAGRPLAGMEGVVLPARDAAPTSGGLPPRIRQLHEVPNPAWDLFPMDEYFAHPYLGVHRGRAMPLLATRGCPYRCSFCSSPQMWTTRYVVRPPEEVVDEIAGYVRDYGIANANFCDLTAITKRSWTLEFCDALDRRGLDITWQLPVGTRAEALDREVLQRLHDTGCRNIAYAPESGSPRMLQVYQKKVKLPQLLESLRTAHEIGLKTHVNIIIGHPEERWSDLARSVAFLLRAAWAGCDDCASIMFCPYPGSADFERLVEDGRLVVDDATCFIGLARASAAARSFNPRMSGRQLRLIQLAMMAMFYGATVVRRPARLREFVRAQRSGHETTYLDQMVRSLRRSRRETSSIASPRP